MTETLVTRPVKIERLKKRPDFLKAAKAPNLARGAVFMQMRPRHDDDPLIRVGFTATKKIGGSVERNRAKRRLREAARLLLPFMAAHLATMCSSPAAQLASGTGGVCLTMSKPR